MKNKQFKDQWPMLKPAIKEKWEKISEKELNQINGDLNQLYNYLEKKYSIKRETAEKEIEQLLSAGAGSSTSYSPKGASYKQKGRK